MARRLTGHMLPVAFGCCLLLSAGKLFSVFNRLYLLGVTVISQPPVLLDAPYRYRCSVVCVSVFSLVEHTDKQMHAYVVGVWTRVIRVGPSNRVLEWWESGSPTEMDAWGGERTGTWRSMFAVNVLQSYSLLEQCVAMRPYATITVTKVTRSSADADGPRDATCQSKSC